jgi:hypothetical protein
MAFQIIELALDANDDVIDRKVVPYPYPTRKGPLKPSRKLRPDMQGRAMILSMINANRLEVRPSPA